jgi:hypothetical protein
LLATGDTTALKGRFAGAMPMPALTFFSIASTI